MASHLCQIVNSTGKTILLKIVGSGPNSIYLPNIQGLQLGLMFAAPPHNVDLEKLIEGERVVIVWKSDGSSILATQRIKIAAPGTITVNQSGTDIRVAAVDSDGNDITLG